VRQAGNGARRGGLGGRGGCDNLSVVKFERGAPVELAFLYGGRNSAAQRRRRQATATMEPFQAARLLERALDGELIARKFGVLRDIAAAQVEQLRRQSVYLNDRYQVNAQTAASDIRRIRG
jgi:hypothetical protein